MNDKKLIIIDINLTLPGAISHVNCRCSFIHIERNPQQLDLFGKTHAAGMSFETLMEKVKI